MDEKDFEHVFNLYYTSLCKYLFLFTDDFDLIEDTVQSVFVKLWEDKYKIAIRQIKVYLFVAARNRILNAIRDTKRRRTILYSIFLNTSAEGCSEDVINIEEFCVIVEQAVSRLPSKMQAVYRLSREKKLSYKEIALLQNISIKTVENQISNALRILIADINRQCRKKGWSEY